MASLSNGTRVLGSALALAPEAEWLVQAGLYRRVDDRIQLAEAAWILPLTVAVPPDQRVQFVDSRTNARGET